MLACSQLVEDDADTALGLSLSLKAHGYQTVNAADGGVARGEPGDHVARCGVDGVERLA